MTGSEIGKLFSQQRSLRRLSLRDVERMVNISNAYLSQLERGKIKNPSMFFIHKLCNLYEIPLDSLMSKCGNIAKLPHLLQAANVTTQEEKELLFYLDFLRSRKPKTDMKPRRPCKPTK